MQTTDNGACAAPKAVCTGLGVRISATRGGATGMGLSSWLFWGGCGRGMASGAVAASGLVKSPKGLKRRARRWAGLRSSGEPTNGLLRELLLLP